MTSAEISWFLVFDTTSLSCLSLTWHPQKRCCIPTTMRLCSISQIPSIDICVRSIWQGQKRAPTRVCCGFCPVESLLKYLCCCQEFRSTNRVVAVATCDEYSPIAE